MRHGGEGATGWKEECVERGRYRCSERVVGCADVLLN